MRDERPHLQVSYADLLVVTQILQDFPASWYVSGGWAIDIFVDRITRIHEDIEIGIARQDQHHLHRQLAGWQLYKAVPRPYGGDLVPWAPDEHLELPIHQIVAQRAGIQPPEFEFFLNEVWDGELQFRINRSIRRPIAEAYLRTAQGIPVIAPEIQLLYKARLHRPKDEHDFQTVLDALKPAQRAWLYAALEIFRPDDPWLAALAQHP
jgi:hypothetical protein